MKHIDHKGPSENYLRLLNWQYDFLIVNSNVKIDIRHSYPIWTKLTSLKDILYLSTVNTGIQIQSTLLSTL
jgi:hypothetical protein